MAENPFTQTSTSSRPDYAAIAATDPKIKSGAQWFWWIVALSVINTIVAHCGGQMSFVMGLGFTLIIDAVFQAYKAVAFVLDFVVLAFFFAMGWFATKGRVWAFAVGIGAYTLDACIYLYFQDWLPFAFHGLALFYLYQAMLRLRNAIQSAGEAPVAGPPPLSP